MIIKYMPIIPSATDRFMIAFDCFECLLIELYSNAKELPKMTRIEKSQIETLMTLLAIKFPQLDTMSVSFGVHVIMSYRLQQWVSLGMYTCNIADIPRKYLSSILLIGFSVRLIIEICCGCTQVSRSGEVIGHSCACMSTNEIWMILFPSR